MNEMTGISRWSGFSGILMRAVCLVLLAGSSVPAQPCADYSCDSLVVRVILDTNGMQDVPVEEVTGRNAAGRIDTLELAGTSLWEYSVTVVPGQIGALDQLTCLLITGMELTGLPASIGSLHNLKRIDLSNNKLTTVPAGIGMLDSLEILSFSHNQLTELPPFITKLTGLTFLSAAHNALRTLPDSLGNLQALRTLSLASNLLRNLPGSIGDITGLEVLGVSYNLLTDLPAVFSRLTNMTTLYMTANQLYRVPDAVWGMDALRFLMLDDNHLEDIPAEIAGLGNLYGLFLNGNRLTALPDAFPGLPRLNHLDASYNLLASLPDSIGSLQSLSELRLSGNRLTALPASITDISGLRELSLDRNDLATLPDSIARLDRVSRGALTQNALCGLSASQLAWALELDSAGMAVQDCPGAPADTVGPGSIRIRVESRSRSHVSISWEYLTLESRADMALVAIWYKAGGYPVGTDDPDAIRLPYFPAYDDWGGHEVWIENMEADTDYYFMAAAQDVHGNWSAVDDPSRTMATTDTLDRVTSFDGRLFYHMPTNQEVYDPGAAVAVTVVSGADAAGVMEVKTVVTPSGPSMDFIEVNAVDVTLTEQLTQVMASAELTFSYADLDVSDVDESSLGVYHHDGDEYVFYGGEVDTLSRTVTVTVPHFSVYSLQGLRKSAGIGDGAVPAKNAAGLPAGSAGLRRLDGRPVAEGRGALPAGVYLREVDGVLHKVLMIDRPDTH